MFTAGDRVHTHFSFGKGQSPVFKFCSYYKKMDLERQGPLFVLFRAGILPPGGCGSPAASGGSSPSSMRLRCAMHWGQSTFLFHRPDAPGQRRSADCPAGPAPADGGLFPPRPASAGRAHRPDNPSALHPAPPEWPRRHNGARRRTAFRPSARTDPGRRKGKNRRNRPMSRLILSLRQISIISRL